MNQNRVIVSTGFLLLIVAVLASVSFLMLQSVPGFSQILLMEPSKAFEIFSNNETTITGASYLMILFGLLLIPLAISMHHAIRLGTDTSLGLGILKQLAIFAGIFQMLGFIVWSVVVPYLAATFFDPAASVATKDGAAVVYSSVSRLFGMGVGGYLSGLLFSAWLAGISIIQAKSAIFRPAVGVLGITAASALVIATFAPSTTSEASILVTFATINNMLVGLWMLVTAFYLFRSLDIQTVVPAHQYTYGNTSRKLDLDPARTSFGRAKLIQTSSQFVRETR